MFSDILQVVKVTSGSYGRNLKRLREREGLSQEEVARRLGTTRQGNLPSREKDPGVPRPQTVLRHAEAINCQPWELLDGLVFPYDELRRKPDATSDAPPSVLDGAQGREFAAIWNRLSDGQRALLLEGALSFGDQSQAAKELVRDKRRHGPSPRRRR